MELLFLIPWLATIAFALLMLFRGVNALERIANSLEGREAAAQEPPET